MTGISNQNLTFSWICSMVIWAGTCLSQPAVVTPRGLGVGISAAHYGVDGAFGIDITSPLVARNHFGFRVRGNIVWLEEYKATLNHWATYHTVLSGLLYRTRLAARADIVTEAGASLIFPGRKFSRETLVTGYYALGGIEHSLGHKANVVTHHISVGVTAPGAHAEKLENSPKYASGFVFNTGFRLYF